MTNEMTRITVIFKNNSIPQCYLLLVYQKSALHIRIDEKSERFRLVYEYSVKKLFESFSEFQGRNIVSMNADS